MPKAGTLSAILWFSDAASVHAGCKTDFIDEQVSIPDFDRLLFLQLSFPYRQSDLVEWVVDISMA